jgi:hypothetical protein
MSIFDEGLKNKQEDNGYELGDYNYNKGGLRSLELPAMGGLTQPTTIIFRNGNDGKPPEAIAELKRLLDLQNSRKSASDEERKFLAKQIANHLTSPRTQSYFEKTAFLNMEAAANIDIGRGLSSFVEKTYAKQGYEIEIIKAKLVGSTTGIPLHESTLEAHKKYLAGQGKNPFGKFGEYNVDTSQTAYYHLETTKSGHNLLHMNDILAGSMVMDFDGDMVTSMVARKRDPVTGKITSEFMIPYKEPLTQKTPRFRNIDYESDIKFNKGKPFGTFAGLNYSDLGVQTNKGEIKAAFSGEMRNRKYSVLGDFLRAYEKPEAREGFSRIRDIDSLRETLAEKSFKANTVGLDTNLYQAQANIENIRALHYVRRANPSLYKQMLLEQQEQIAEYLRTSRTGDQTILGTKIIGKKQKSELYGDNFEGFLNRLTTINLDDADNLTPETNQLLHDQLVSSTLTRGVSDRFLGEYHQTLRTNDPANPFMSNGQLDNIDWIGKGPLANPNYIFEIEGGMKTTRTTNKVQEVQDGVKDTYRRYVDGNPFINKLKNLHKLKPQEHDDLISELLGQEDGEFVDKFVDAMFLNDVPYSEREKTIAQLMANKKAKPVGAFFKYEDGQYKKTTLARLQKEHIVETQELFGFAGIRKNRGVDYTASPLAILIRDINGNLVGPSKDDIIGVSVMGNVAAMQGSKMTMLNREQYLALELERRLQDSRFAGSRGFLEAPEQGSFSASDIKNKLMYDNDGFRKKIFEAYQGVHQAPTQDDTPIIQDLINRLSSTNKEEVSRTHKEIIRRYDLTHRRDLMTAVQGHLRDIVAAVGGRNNIDARIENYGWGENGIQLKGVADDGIDSLTISAMSSTLGIDTEHLGMKSEHKANIMMEAFKKFGGFNRKNTGSESDRYLLMTMGERAGEITPVGTNKNYFMPRDLAKRMSDIQRQTIGGTALGKVRVALAETEISEEYFNMINPSASLGLKRADEGLILISKQFSNRAAAKIKAQLRVGPTIGADDFESALASFVEFGVGEARVNSTDRRLTPTELKEMRRKLTEEFKNLYRYDDSNGKRQYVTTDEGLDRVISKNFKLVSLLGDKGVVSVVDSIQDEDGKEIDILMHINQARSRSNEIARYQEVIQTAVNEGRLSVEDLGPEFQASAKNGFINFDEIYAKHGGNQEEFLAKIKTGFIDPLERAQQAVAFRHEGVSQHFKTSIFETDNFVAAGNWGDIYRDQKAAELIIESQSKNKLIGRIANALDNETGSGLVGLGVQLGMHMAVSYASQKIAVNALETGVVQHMTAEELLINSKKMLGIGKALQDSLEDYL